MEITKIILIGIIGAISYVYLKSINSELSSLLVLGVSIVIIILSLSYIVESLNFFKNFTKYSGISSQTLMLVVKITVIAYLIEFSVTLCEDLNVKSIGNKIELSGRLFIFVLSIPIFNTLYETLIKLIL